MSIFRLLHFLAIVYTMPILWLILVYTDTQALKVLVQSSDTLIMAEAPDEIVRMCSISLPDV